MQRGFAHEDAVLKRCGSWDDFEKAARASENSTEQGDLLERLTQLYLQTCPEYRTKLKHVWHWSEVPLSARKRLNLPLRDEGIDLVAVTREGAYWSIQAKNYWDGSKSLNRKTLSTWASLTWGHCKGFSLGVVVHPKPRPIKKSHLLGGPVTEIGLARWLDTTAEDWRAIRAKIGGKATRPKKRSPRPHQRTAVRKAKEHVNIYQDVFFTLIV